MVLLLRDRVRQPLIGVLGIMRVAPKTNYIWEFADQSSGGLNK